MNYICISIFVLCALVLSVHAECKADLNSFEQTVLDKHNELRRLHEDTEDLCYGQSGDDIDFYSQEWADEIAGTQMMSHSTSTDYYDSSNPYGENIAYAATTAEVPGEDAAYNRSTEAWYDEIVDWDFDTSASTGGTTGHFTQVVWKNSAQVNCGYAAFVKVVGSTNFNAYFVVCQYYPAGNYIGMYGENVGALAAEEDEGENTDDNNTDDNNADGSTDDNNADGSTDDNNADGSTDDNSTDDNSTDDNNADGSTDDNNADGSTDDDNADDNNADENSDGMDEWDDEGNHTGGATGSAPLYVMLVLSLIGVLILA